MPFFTSNNTTVIDGIYLEEYNRVYLTDVELLERNVGGELWSWGQDNAGQLGDGTIIHRSSPVQTISGGNNWKQLSSGGTERCAAIKTDGTLWMWGTNSFGNLGDNTTIRRSSPVQTVAGGTNWKQVSVGTLHTGAVKTDGTLWLWGLNGDGQLGDNTRTSYSSPVQTVAAGKNWKQVSASASVASSSAIKTDGTLWVWGQNYYGNLGTNNRTSYSSPVQTIAGGTNWKTVGTDGARTLAIKTDGTLWTWGYNDVGQLGTNDVIHRSSPVQTIAGGTNWKEFGCASNGITGAIKTDGTLWTWGYGFLGANGDNTSVHRSSPIQTAAGGTNWKSISQTLTYPAAIKTDGTLWRWGRDATNANNVWPFSNRSSPIIQSAGNNNWKQIDSGFGGNHAITYSES